MFVACKGKLAAACLLCVLLAGCAREGGGVYDSAGAAAQSKATPAVAVMANKASESLPKEKGRAAAAPDAAANQVVIENFAFKPATLTVKVGATVTWVNRDDVPHTATESDKRFDSGALDTDGQFSYTFKAAGTYKYFCALHPKMTAQVVVTK